MSAQADDTRGQPPPAVDLKQFISRWFLPARQPEPKPVAAPPAPSQAGIVHRHAVPVVTLLLLVGVICSMIPGMHPVVRSETWRVTMTAAFVGIVTNWIAITMLFRPRRRWLGFVQGIIPARRKEVIAGVAEAVQQNLINPSMIELHIRESRIVERSLGRVLRRFGTVLRNEQFKAEFQVLLKGNLEEFLRNEALRTTIAARIDSAITVWCGANFGRTLGGIIKPFFRKPAGDMVDQALAELPAAVDHVCAQLTGKLDTLPQQIEPYLPEIERSLTAQICAAVQSFDVEAIVKQKMMEMDDRAIESMIKQAANEQLMWVQLLGAVLGAMAGFVVSAVQ